MEVNQKDFNENLCGEDNTMRTSVVVKDDYVKWQFTAS